MVINKRIQSLQETLQEGATQPSRLHNQPTSNWQDEMKDSQRLLALLREALKNQGHVYLAQELISVRRDFNRLICFFTNAASAARLKMLSSQLLSHIKHEHFVQIDTKIAPSLQAPYKPPNPTKTLDPKVKETLSKQLDQLESPQLKSIFNHIIQRKK